MGPFVEPDGHPALQRGVVSAEENLRGFSPQEEVLELATILAGLKPGSGSRAEARCPGLKPGVIVRAPSGDRFAGVVVRAKPGDRSTGYPPIPVLNALVTH